MTTNELLNAMVTKMLDEGKDPHYVIGYLQSHLAMVIECAPKNYHSKCHSDLVWHLSQRTA